MYFPDRGCVRPLRHLYDDYATGWKYVRQAVGLALYTLEQFTISDAKILRYTTNKCRAELSMGWVDPWVGLDWVGLGSL